MNEIINDPELSDLIEVTRDGPGTYVKGRWEPAGEPVVIEMRAVVLPLGPTDLATDVDTAGFETKGAIKLYTESELVASDEKTKVNRDEIRYREKDYVVESSSERYQLEDLYHWKTIAKLKDS